MRGETVAKPSADQIIQMQRDAMNYVQPHSSSGGETKPRRGATVYVERDGLLENTLPPFANAKASPRENWVKLLALLVILLVSMNGVK